MHALASVVIPAYNHQAFVRQAVESALAQDWPELEVLAVDDGSSDQTLARLREIDDPRLRIIAQDNQGAHAALNRGLAEARGRWLALLNSDDMYAPGRLRRLIEAMSAAAGKAQAPETPLFAFSGLNLVDEAGRPLPREHERRVFYDGLTTRAVECEPADGFLLGNPAMTSSNFIFSRAAYEAVGGFRALRYAHDWDWCLRARGKARMLRVDEPLLAYRAHAANTLAEGDFWRHVAENAFLFASHLRREGLPEDVDAAMGRYCGLYLRNESFLPAAVLLVRQLLDAGLSEDALLERLGRDLPRRLEELYADSGLCNECMLSPEHLNDRLTQLPLAQLPLVGQPLAGLLGRLRRLSRPGDGA